MKSEERIKVTRKEFLRRDADKLALMMRVADFRGVRVIGKRGAWVARGLATLSQLASFAVDEAYFDMRRRA